MNRRDIAIVLVVVALIVLGAGVAGVFTGALAEPRLWLAAAVGLIGVAVILES